jgi:hypothetical protein
VRPSSLLRKFLPIVVRRLARVIQHGVSPTVRLSRCYLPRTVGPIKRSFFKQENISNIGHVDLLESSLTIELELDGQDRPQAPHPPSLANDPMALIIKDPPPKVGDMTHFRPDSDSHTHSEATGAALFQCIQL